MATEAIRTTDFRTHYCNTFLISSGDNELCATFGMQREGGKLFEASCEVAMTWRAAKIMRDQLNTIIAKYEAGHPTILTPGGVQMERQ